MTLTATASGRSAGHPAGNAEFSMPLPPKTSAISAVIFQL
jgi:hypothetical protein